MRLFQISLLLLSILHGLTASPEPAKAEPTQNLSFKIDDSKCYVGIAAVYLTVTELKQVDGNLVGGYEINVPLKKSKNDKGKIVLPLDTPLATIRKQGGTLRGKAYSQKKARPPNLIVCELGPIDHKKVSLAITTNKRTLHFKSKYKLIHNDASH